MTRIELADGFIKLIALPGHRIKDTRYELISNEAVCLEENEHYFEVIE